MRINLFGGPGCGKSTTAAEIFSNLKIDGYKIELVHEYVKKWAYIGREVQSFDQVYIFAQQLHSEDIMLRSSDHIVTDAPIMLTAVYGRYYKQRGWEGLLDVAQEFTNVNPELNILLRRASLPYQEVGRFQTSDEAIEIDKLMKTTLDDLNLTYYEWDVGNTAELIDSIKSAVDHSAVI